VFSVWADLIDYWHSITGSKGRASEKGMEILCALSCEASFWAIILFHVLFSFCLELLVCSNKWYSDLCLQGWNKKWVSLSALMSILVYVAKSVDWDPWHECFANSWDEWVSADRLLKHTEENLVKQKALDKKQGVEKGTKSGRSAQTKTRSSAGEFFPPHWPWWEYMIHILAILAKKLTISFWSCTCRHKGW